MSMPDRPSGDDGPAAEKNLQDKADSLPCPLPQLAGATRVRITREGGIAYLPGLLRTRQIDLSACPADERRRICQALERSAGLARPDCGAGDQRYFRVEVVYVAAGAQDQRTLDFRVPEQDAPQPLRDLWEDRRDGPASR